MMDISDATRGSIVGREGLKIDLKSETREGAEETVDDGRFSSDPDDGLSHKLKRSFDDELMNSKKRRKQLKPIKIATNVDEMVKVPKQIIGLNNDLGDVDDLPHAVPKRLSPLLNDVHLKYSLRSETSAGEKGNENFAAIDAPRLGEKPELTDLNVPNIEMGPNYITNPHFMFPPLSFPPVKSAAFWSEANLKIFNQEAYCELCKKEFCNKYFLKTHKANKHGIYVDMPTGKVPAKVECKDATAVAASATLRPSENGKASGDGECAFCDLCNKKFCNKYFVKRHKSKSHGLVEEDAPSLPSHETETSIVQTSANNSTKQTDSLILDSPKPLALVSKEPEADNQKANRRGELARDCEEENKEPKGKDEREEEEEQQEEEEEEEEEGPLNLIVNAKDNCDNEGKAEEEPEDEVDDCSSENIEKLQTMLLRLNPSELDLKACTACTDSEDLNDAHHKSRQEKKEKEYLFDVNDSSSESKLESVGPKLDNQDFYNAKLDHPKQMKPTSSYCEICNKELCNKYFMKTHMQRMHGIEIEHGTQIGGVICNICNKELCSKYFLRVHKQNTHGITSPNTLMGPSTSGNAAGPKTDLKGARSDPRFPSNFTQVCYICNKRFRNPKWLQAHFLSDHADEVSKLESKDLEEGNVVDESLLKAVKIHGKTPKDSGDLFVGNSFGLLENPAESLDVISKIFWENSVPTKLFNCSQCPFTTSVLAFLFVHERSHFVLAQDQPEMVKPSVSLQNLIHDKTFWQHKITQQMPECLDLSAEKPNYVSLEQNGS